VDEDLIAASCLSDLQPAQLHELARLCEAQFGMDSISNGNLWRTSYSCCSVVP
jgi:hypothetical protein